MKKILVLYHKNCPDGFGGAWAAWKKFGNKAEYVAVDPDTLPEKFPKGKEIYSVDISYPVSVQKKLREKNKSLVILDHHVSRKNDTEAFPENTFNNNHSGAVLGWRYFHPKKKVPKFLEYIEDYDLWKFSLPKTRSIIPYLHMQKTDFITWGEMADQLEKRNWEKIYYERGMLLQKYEDKIVADLIKKADLVLFERKKVYAVNSSLSNIVDKIAHNLCLKKQPFSIVWHERRGELKVSLRADGKIDVSKIAQKYGGGGHKSASGFVIKNGKKPWKMVKTKDKKPKTKD